MNTEELQAMIKKHVAALSEHCESVRIFVTVPSNDGNQTTKACDDGAGNFYAQYGQITEWIDIQREYQRVWARDHAKSDDP